jgi:hypothetical protein
MLRNLTPLISRIRPRLGLTNSVEQNHHRRWVIAAGTETRVPPAIFEEDDLARIVGVPVEDTIAGNVAQARGGLVQHRPTIAYELRNAVLSGGHLFTWRAFSPISMKPPPAWVQTPERRFEEAALASTHYGQKYFGHWLYDDLPLTLAAESLATPVSVLEAPSPHQSQYLNFFKLAPTVVTSGFFSRLTVIDDIGQNEFKLRRAELLRNRAQSRFPSGGHRRVMILRGSSGERKLLINEPEVAAALADRGFAVLDPYGLTATEIIEFCIDAECVVGVEGSQLVHGLCVMRPGGTLVSLQPPRRFCTVLKGCCDVRNICYAFQVGVESETDFTIDIDAIHRLLDRVE